jgi:hypothetical protein
MRLQGYTARESLWLTVAMAVADPFAGASPVSAEIISITCVQAVAGAPNNDATTKSIGIDTSKLESIHASHEVTVELDLHKRHGMS